MKEEINFLFLNGVYMHVVFVVVVFCSFHGVSHLPVHCSFGR